MNRYTITKISGKPDWSTIPSLKVDNYQWEPELDIQMTAQICYDESGLRLHLRAWEKNIRAEHREPLAQVCEDSCMEFFFRPMEEELRYMNVEMNPNGCTYVGFGGGRPNRTRLILRNEDALLEKTYNYVEDGWELFYTIPLSLLRIFYPDYQLAQGKKIYANCYKCGDKTQQPHFITWNRIDSEKPNFHKPEDFGLMELG